MAIAAVAARQHFLRQWGGVLFGVDKIQVIHFLQGRGLLSVLKICQRCQGQMQLERNDASPDGYRWYNYLLYNVLSNESFAY